MNITFTKQEKIEIIETAISWIVVLMMFLYGFGKIMQFNGATEIDKTVSELTGMELMWAFYGYSYSFALILGAFEIIGAILVFFKRTRIIGCFLITTILTNIIIQDIIFEVHKGALYAAIIYQAFIFIILWMNRKEVIAVFKTLTNYKKPKQSLNKKVIRFLVLAIMLVILFVFQYYLASVLSHLL